jgi:hypothetical protein
VKCTQARNRFSGLRDDDLARDQEAAVRGHLASCPECTAEWDASTSALDGRARAPRLEPSESMAGRVLNRLEVERRGPGLALQVRPVWAARPLIWPSLVPAALVVLSVIAAAVLLDPNRDVLPDVYVRPGSVAWGTPPEPGTELNPFVLSAALDGPVHRGLGVPAEVLAELTDGTFFVKTVVARDGSVAGVTLLAGDEKSAARLVDALRQQRFEPARYQGRPVAVSLYRLISRMEVRAPMDVRAPVI